MTENYRLQNIRKKHIALREKRAEIISATPEKALDIILSSPTPAALTQSFPEEDLYFLVHHIGIEDAVPVLALADSAQWGYMVDVEVWGKDRLDIVSVTEWLKILLVADGRRAVKWLISERLEFTELYLFRNIDVIVREENQDPSDFPDEFFTYDDYFYIRIRENPVRDEETETLDSGERQLAVKAFLDTLVSIDIVLFQQVMLEATSVMPAETEEEEYRMRNVRLAEKGFMPYDEAFEIFSPISADYFTDKIRKYPAGPVSEEEISTVPSIFMSELTIQNHFTRALTEVSSAADLESLQLEFASLCNQLISVDKNRISERKALQGIVNKACGFLSLGMEILMEKEESSTAALILDYGLKDIFRLGYGEAMKLKWTAERFSKEGWFQSAGLPLSFWGEQWVGVLGGLLVERPLFYDNYETGVLYRDFSSKEDLGKTSEALRTIRLFDSLLSAISPVFKPFTGFFLTCENILLTLWACSRTCRNNENPGPVPLNKFRPFFNSLWEEGRRDIETPGRISLSAKEDFLDWLSESSGFSKVEISEQLAEELEKIFREIEKEYGCVSSENIDPDLVYHFSISG